MYVCICNAITDTQIRKAADDGVKDLWELQRELGVAAGCGSCKEMASDILRSSRNKSLNARTGNSRTGQFAQPVLYRPSAG